MNESQQLLKSVISRIATGPDLSKDIEFEEAKHAMQAVLHGKIDPIQTAIFLIALRMKRETMAENKGILAAILAESDKQIAKVDALIDIGDPYSGYDRSIPISSFLPPLLAELGLPTVIHGLDSVTPKFGLTHRHIYQALDESLGRSQLVDLSTSTVKNRIENSDIAWGYVDQSQYCAGLHHIITLRDKMIKRTVINTVETLIAPIRGKKTHSILGYVHKPYPPIYAELAEFSGLDSSLLIRGVEGGVVPSLRQTGLMIAYDGVKERARLDINPKELGIEQNMRAIGLPDKWAVKNKRQELAKYTVQLGVEALSGKQGIYYDGLVYVGSLILWHMNQVNTLVDAAGKVRAVLDSSKTLSRL